MKLTIQITFLVFFLVLFGFIQASACPRQDEKIGPKEMQIIKQTDQQIMIYMKQYQIPGVAIALVDKKGILWSKGYGYLSKTKKKKVNIDTLFSFESNSKMFTALGVLFSQQEGLLKLNDSVSRYLPTLQVHCARGLCNANMITLKELISHSSGFMHEAPVGNNFDGAQSSFHEHILSILNHDNWLLFTPGTQKNYSNVGFDLAGYVLEKVSKKQFAEYMHDSVLVPLGMMSSTFDSSALLHEKNKAVGYAPVIGEILSNKSMLPSGGLYASVKDMAKYIQFQLNNGSVCGKQLLDRTLLNQMYDLAYPVEGQETGYTLGLWRGLKNHQLFLMHLGRGFGFSSTVIWYPKLGYGVVVVLNKFGSNVDTLIANNLLDELLNINNSLSGKQIDLKRSIKLTLAVKNFEKRIAGNYVSSQGNISLGFNKDSVFGISGMLSFGPFGNDVKTDFVPLQYLHGSKFISSSGDVYTYKKIDASCSLPYLQRQQDGFVWYYNDSAKEVFGLNQARWRQYIGKYYIKTYGLKLTHIVSIKNGYLYFDNYQLKEIEPGLFKTPTGGIVDLIKNQNPSFENIQLIRSGEK